MGTLFNILKGPISDTLNAVGNLIDRFVVTGDDKLKAQQELIQIQQQFQTSILEAEQKWAETQASVITAEAKSDSWLARNWRPILMLTFTYIVAHTYIFAPLFSLKELPIPPDMWELLKIGMGGYIIGRSFEKTIPAATEAVTKVLKK